MILRQTCHPSFLYIHFSLFPILYQLFQSSLLQYQTMFPHVFSSSGGKGGADNPIVSELGTLNAVMKYQGYTTQQEVYDTNALFVFKIIDSMTREAKEMEKANKRASRKWKEIRFASEKWKVKSTKGQRLRANG